ncbi:MAG: 23S rRNA (adenine(2503)-C(2))-methyltransferase RlmN [Gammaproteobacteria bacterium]
MSDGKINLLNHDKEGLEKLFASWGEPSYRAHQVMKWIYHEFVTDFQQMTNLSKSLREKLGDLCEIRPPEVVTRHISDDGSQKWLLALPGKGAIETVYIPDHGRTTLCVSSQAGCKLNCTFCHTAKQGFQRDLSVAEIIGQLWVVARILRDENVLAKDGRPITNIVMMGMGEPLLNFNNVVPALKLMRDDFGFGLSKKRVTLSTSGVVPQIYALKEAVDVALAVSLHAPDNALRNEIVPLNKKYPIEVLLEACRDYVGDHKKRHVTMEYVMLKGVNDTPKHAKALARLLEGISVKVNLIPFNPFPGTEYERSTDEAISTFQNLLIRAGYNTLVRRTRGDDIVAACGQLAGQVVDRTKRSLRFQNQLVTILN